MKGTIDGIEVYLDEGQLPAFTLSLISLTDPSKVQGVRSTTIRIVSTPEARRVLGTEYMAQARRGSRPVLRIGDGDVDVFRAEVVPVKYTRDVIECLAVSGNASWFDYAKGVKLNEADFPAGPIVKLDRIIDSWDDYGEPLIYWPLINDGSLDAATVATVVDPTELRPGINIWRALVHVFGQEGWTLAARGKFADYADRLVVLAPTDKAKVLGDPDVGPNATLNLPDYQALAATYASVPAFPLVTGAIVDIMQRGNEPGGWSVYGVDAPPIQVGMQVLTGSPHSPTEGWHNFFKRYAMPFDGWLRIDDVHVSIGLPTAPGFGKDYGVVVWDTTDGVELGYLPVYTTGTESTGAGGLYWLTITGSFPPMYVIGGHMLRIGVVYGAAYSVDEAVTVFEDGGSGTAMRIITEVDYQAGQELVIRSVMPEWTLADAVKAIALARCLVFVTDGNTIEAWEELDYFRLPVAPFRDWRERMDTTTPPARVRENAPKGITLRYREDDKDAGVSRLNRIYGTYAQAQIVERGVSAEQVVEVPFAATEMRRVVEDTGTGAMQLTLPRMDLGDDPNKPVPRLLVRNGYGSGHWTVPTYGELTAYPQAYFLLPSGEEQVPMAFGNPIVLGGGQPLLADNQWKRRLNTMRSDTLEAYFFLRDHEIQDFDFGMPTLVDDGSGPAWYWVQEIRDHRFGAGLPTKVTLVKIPGMEYAAPANPPVEFPEPPEPFVCEGPGTASVVVAPGGGTKLFVSQGTSTHFTVRGPSQAFTWPINAPDGIEIGEGPWCIYASDADGNMGGSIYDLQIGMFTENDIMSVDLSRMNDLRDVYMFEIETAATFAPFNADLENISISGAALISVLPSFVNVDGLQSFSIDDMSVLSALPDFSPDALATFFIQSCQSLASIGTLPMINNLDIADTGITDPAVVDALVNALHPASGGIATFNGLLSLRTSASDTNYNACISAGWTII